MEHTVLLTKHPNDGFIARSLLLPEIVVTGIDEAEVLAQLRTILVQLQQNSRIVQIDVPTPKTDADNPWLRMAGIFADDPTWEEFQSAITAHRRSLDAQLG